MGFELMKASMEGTGSVSEADVNQTTKIVTRISRNAIYGSSCRCVRDGCVVPARYLLDRKLEVLSVITTGERFEQIMTCELTSVRDIVSLSDQNVSAVMSEMLVGLNGCE